MTQRGNWQQWQDIPDLQEKSGRSGAQFCHQQQANFWLFTTSQAGTRANANLNSLIKTEKVNELKLYAYLKKVFTLLPQAKRLEDIDALLPWGDV